MNRVLAVLGLLAAGGASSAAAQFALEARGGYLDRRLADSGSVEHQSGIIAGGAVGLTTPGIGIMVGADAGKLKARSTNTPEVDFARLTVGATVAAAGAPWVRLRGDVTVAVYVSPAGAQRWVLPRIGVELRAPFTSLPGAAYFAGAATLGASSNGPEASGGLALRAGAEVGSTHVKGFAQYQMDRLSFTPTANREEQWGEIAVGLRVSP